ncbi:type IV pilus assembly protein PilQ [Sinobacterium caligoides]|uniref:Type IV pilus assembly protein PilQ n=1 Tax=Sinobacterium caligoides TaxID=933926 RepID=A0A3N2DQ87_9GAMM|nr:type IV pilus secretin PilQ family protein [Sinobacterium caligoides]ROS01953.1 type IV pilus assembly protein PilQ [Sinobacterium caligoides]
MKTVMNGVRSIQQGVRVMRKVLGALVLLAVSLYSTLAAAVVMDGIHFNSLPGERVEIRMSFDGVPPEPKVYTIESPARISLDLTGVTSALEKKKYLLNVGVTDTVTVLGANDRTRVVVGMSRLANYSSRVEGQELVLEIGNEVQQSYIKKSTDQLTKKFNHQTSSASQINSLDFQRGEDGEGKLLLGLSSSDVNVDMAKEGGLIKLTFANTGIEDGLERTFDVLDFATPVKTVVAKESRDGKSAVVTLEPMGEYDYLAYQVEDTYVISVRPLTPEEVQAKSSEFQYTGDRLSLNFQDIEVRAVLQLIADFTGLNLVASDNVTGKITLRLQNVPWDQALDLVLKTKALGKRQIGNVLMIAPAEELANQERQRIEANKQIEELAPLSTELFRIRYHSAEGIFELFKDDGDDGSKSILSPRGRAIVDPRTNSLIITETAMRLEEFRSLLAAIDIPVRQVLIEARLVAADKSFREELGISWGGSEEGKWDHFNIGGREGADGTTPLVVDLGVGGATSGFNVGYTNGSVNLSAEISAMESNGRGELVAEPKVITGDKQRAVIKAGRELPYLESSASGETTVTFKEAVLKLEVTPYITPDNRVLMELEINQDDSTSSIQGEFGALIPIINTRQIKTKVLVKNGETVVLGGVFKTVDKTTIQKTPFFGDIPYIGRLFRNQVQENSKEELLIFITPRILSDDLLD